MLQHYKLENGRIVACSLEKSAAFLEDTAARTVEKTQLSDDVLVSTVFLCFDHSFNKTGPAVLFETMVFGGVDSEYQERYSTYGDAKIGHFRIVDQQIANGYSRISENDS